RPRSRWRLRATADATSAASCAASPVTRSPSSATARPSSSRSLTSITQSWSRTGTSSCRGKIVMEAKLDMVLEQVGRDKNIDKGVLLSALEQAILTAAKRTFGMNREMEAKYNAETGSVDLFLIVNVVEDPDDAIPGREISVDQARTAG